MGVVIQNVAHHVLRLVYVHLARVDQVAHFEFDFLALRDLDLFEFTIRFLGFEVGFVKLGVYLLGVGLEQRGVG